MSDPSVTDIAAVRFLVGDPDGGTGTTTVLSDAEIQFALDQTGEDTYAAGAVCSRALAARYARRVDTKFETIDTKYSQLHAHYSKLALQLDRQSKLNGKRGLGVPSAGGISRAEDKTARADEDRVRPFFRDSMMNNPPPTNARTHPGE